MYGAKTCIISNKAQNDMMSKEFKTKIWYNYEIHRHETKNANCIRLATN